MRKTIIILILIKNSIVFAMTDPDSINRFVGIVTCSHLISFFENQRFKEAPGDLKFGYGIFGRLMWHPIGLISFSLMGGYMKIATDDIDKNIPIKASLSAIPIQAIISLNKYNFEIGLGIGPYIMVSNIKVGTGAVGRRLELGMTLFGNYYFNIQDNLLIGPELRIVYFSFREILSIMPSININYELRKY